MDALIRQLQSDRTLVGECPSCAETFRLVDATLFPLGGDWPAAALELLKRRREEIRERREELKKQRRLMTRGARLTAEAVNLGKIVEKIAPSFRSFEFAPRDCRALLEPIDYIIFQGLARTGRAEALWFVDVKSGRANLKPGQRQIRDRVQAGDVRFKRLPAPRRTR